MVSIQQVKWSDVDLSGWTENAKIVLQKRYFLKNQDGDCLEDISSWLKRVALYIASAEVEYGATNQQVAELADKFYVMMANQEALPNTPTLANAAKPQAQLAACFSVGVEDTMDGIYHTLSQTASIMKSGGGYGVNFSKIRHKDAYVSSTGGKAGGVIQFLKLYNESSDTVKQGGMRKGASICVLDVYHPEIVEFIRCKQDTTQINNFNISVAISDEFMDAVVKNKKWWLKHPGTGEKVKSIDAKELFDEIVKSAHATGEPGILFMDEINRHNPTPHLGKINTTNPCLPGWAKVYKKSGLTKLSDVEVGDIIWSEVGWTRVINKVSNGIQDVWKYTTSTGHIFCSTSDHKIIYNNEKMPVGSAPGLTRLYLPDDDSFTDNNLQEDIIDRQIVSTEEVYDITVGNFMHTFWCDGFNISNCGELPLLPYESCNLASINMDKMLAQDVDGNWKINQEKLEETIKLMVRFLDNVITINKFPLKEIEEVTLKTRKIGLGIMGFADALIRMKIPYGSEECIQFIRQLMSIVKNTSEMATIDLGKERGPFPEIEGSMYSDGRRNATTTCMAPTGCQKPDTLISTDGGLLRLSELVNRTGDQWQDLVDTWVAQEDGEYESVDKGFVNGYAKTKVIRMHSGLDLEATPNHQYKIIRNGVYDWVQADDIGIGDIIPVKMYGYEGHDKAFKTLDYDPNRCKYDAKFPENMNGDVAYFLGVYYASGMIYNNSISIRLAANNQELADHIKDIVHNLFGCEVVVIPDKGGKFISVYVNSILVIKWLFINGLAKPHHGAARIPRAIRTASIDSASRFIQAFYDCATSKQTDVYYMRIPSYVVMQDLIVLMRTLGDNVTISISNQKSSIYKIVRHTIQEELTAKQKSDTEMVRNLISDEFIPDYVVGVRDSSNMTLDLSVPKTNYYIANGVVSHNTISMLADCSCGIEPLFAVAFERNILDGTKMAEKHKYLNSVLGNYNIQLSDIVNNHGSLVGLDLPRNIEESYRTAHDVTPEQHVQVQAEFQKFIDNSVSKTVNLPESAIVDDVRSVFMLAWKNKCKGCTVYRDKCRDNQPMSSGNTKSEDKQSTPMSRPNQLNGLTEKFPVGSCGSLYVTVNRDSNGNVIEVMSATGRDSGCHSLVSSLCRTISMALRSGVPMKVITDQLLGIRCLNCVAHPDTQVLSCPDAIGRAIMHGVNQQEKFVLNKTTGPSTNLCPDCGTLMQRSENCWRCPCGYSKCS